MKKKEINKEERMKAAKYMFSIIIVIQTFVLIRTQPIGLVAIFTIPIIAGVRAMFKQEDGTLYFRKWFNIVIVTFKYIAVIIVVLKVIEKFLPEIYITYF